MFIWEVGQQHQGWSSWGHSSRAGAAGGTVAGPAAGCAAADGHTGQFPTGSLAAGGPAAVGLATRTTGVSHGVKCGLCSQFSGI